MVVAAQEPVQSLRALHHVGIGAARRVVPLIVLARRLQGGELAVELCHRGPPIRHRTARWRPAERSAHHRHRRDHVGVQQAAPAGHPGAGVVSDHRGYPLVAERGDDAEHVPHQVEHAKRRQVTVERAIPAAGRAVASLIGGHHVIAGGGQRRHHPAPTVAQLREPVQQHQQRAPLALLSRLQDVHVEPVHPGQGPRPNPRRPQPRQRAPVRTSASVGHPSYASGCVPGVDGAPPSTLSNGFTTTIPL